MPVGMTLPSKSVILRFPPSRSSTGTTTNGIDIDIDIEDNGDEENGGVDINGEEESYQLLELPLEILKKVEANKGKTFPLTIKGKPSDDAVLCTSDSTFLLRTIGISNSLLVCRTPSSSSSSATTSTITKPTLEVRDICHQVLECVPIAPNLERVRTILKESAWKGLNNDSLSSDDDDDDKHEIRGTCNNSKRKRGRDEKNGIGSKKKTKRWTREQLESVVQASEDELERGLKERNIMQVDGRMLYLPPAPLKDLLTIILSLITIHSTSNLNSGTGTPKVSSEPILHALTEDYSLSPSFSKSILKLFGSIQDQDSEWTVDVNKIVREIGIAILHSPSPSTESSARGSLTHVSDGKIPLDDLLHLWKSEVGEDWENHVDIKLLEGEYLLTPSNSTLINSSLITPFASSALPLHPATRFADLFLTRQRWRPDEMAPFLKGLTRDGDNKERDKLVAKYVRVVKEKEGVWWYPRR